MTKEVSGKQVREAMDMLNLLSLGLPLYLYLNLCTRTPALYLHVERWDKAQFGDYYTVSDEVAHRVETLLGPHARACFTAWAIQQYDGPER